MVMGLGLWGNQVDHYIASHVLLTSITCYWVSECQEGYVLNNIKITAELTKVVQTPEFFH